jgi:hypothetical protein
MLRPMNKTRVPPHWPYLRVGEQVHTKLPRHRIDDIVASLGERGYAFSLEPSPQGYFVKCEARPPVDPAADAKFAGVG